MSNGIPNYVGMGSTPGSTPGSFANMQPETPNYTGMSAGLAG